MKCRNDSYRGHLFISIKLINCMFGRDDKLFQRPD